MTGDFTELQDRFRIIGRISRGTFSIVYLGELLHNAVPGDRFALKRIIQTTSPERIAREMKILVQIAGRSHICPLVDAFRYRDQVTLVLPYFQHDQFRSYYAEMDLNEIRSYFRALFESLQLIHSLGIVHRDIKPSNFLYNRSERKFQLIDFGLAQQVDEFSRPEPAKAAPLPTARNSGKRARPELKAKPTMRSALPSVARAGTRGYRAPEVLLLVPSQTTAIDIWSVGSIMLSMASKRYPFFESNDDLSAVAEIAHIFGSKRLHHAAIAVGRSITLPEKVQNRPWRELCAALSKADLTHLPDEFFDLLERCLDPIPSRRITASEALRHPFLMPPVSTGAMLSEKALFQKVQSSLMPKDDNASVVVPQTRA